MEPVKIRGTWRWTDQKGRYRRGTDEQYKAYLNGVPAVEPVVAEEPVIQEEVLEEAPPIEEVYNEGLFESGNESA